MRQAELQRQVQPNNGSYARARRRPGIRARSGRQARQAQNYARRIGVMRVLCRIQAGRCVPAERRAAPKKRGIRRVAGSNRGRTAGKTATHGSEARCSAAPQTCTCSTGAGAADLQCSKVKRGSGTRNPNAETARGRNARQSRQAERCVPKRLIRGSNEAGRCIQSEAAGNLRRI